MIIMNNQWLLRTVNHDWFTGQSLVITVYSWLWRTCSTASVARFKSLSTWDSWYRSGWATSWSSWSGNRDASSRRMLNLAGETMAMNGYVKILVDNDQKCWETLEMLKPKGFAPTGAWCFHQHLVYLLTVGTPHGHNGVDLALDPGTSWVKLWAHKRSQNWGPCSDVQRIHLAVQ